MTLALCNRRQRQFVDEYIANGGNGTKAYMEAYGITNYESAAASASKLLNTDKIKSAIEERQRDIDAMYGVGVAWRLEKLSQAVEGALDYIPVGEAGQKMNSPSAVAALISEINKMTGGHAPTKVAETDSDGYDKPEGIKVEVVAAKPKDEPEE